MEEDCNHWSISPLMTTTDGILRTSPGYVCQLFGACRIKNEHGYISGHRTCQSTELSCTTAHKTCETVVPPIIDPNDPDTFPAIKLSSITTYTWEECGHRCTFTCNFWEFNGNNVCTLWKTCPGRTKPKVKKGFIIGDRNCPSPSKQYFII